MAEDRALLPDPFSGAPKEDATQFWRRLETYLEFKGSGDGDKLRLVTAMLVLTARDWLENLPEERKDTFAHLKSAFAEKFIQPAILKWQSANDIFTKPQMQTETVDEYANRIKNLGKRIEFTDSTLMFALLNDMKPAIKGQVLAKNPQSFAEAVDGARLAELSVLVSASPTEKLITEQLAQMRCDIKQLAGKGAVNDPSITTLATEGEPAPPYRHVEFASANQMPLAQCGHNTLHRDLCAQRQQVVTACLHRRFTVIGRIIVNCQCDRRRVLTTPYVPNVDIASMMTLGVAQRLVNSAGHARVSDT